MKLPLLIAPALLAFALPLQAETAQELEYQSAFEGYKAYSDSEIQNWPAMIKQVEEIGGWRVYSREPAEAKPMGQVNEVVPTAPTLPPAKPHQHGGAQ